MGTKLVSSVTTEFAKGLAAQPNSPDGSSWDTNPANPVDYRFVRVTGSVDVPTALIFAFKSLQSGTATRTASVEARAIAAQAMITTYTQGLLPFSPVGHNLTPDNFGLTPTVLYTLRYPSPGSPGMNVCAGDVGQAFIDQLPSEDRGYWVQTAPRLSGVKSLTITRSIRSRSETLCPWWAAPRTRKGMPST